MRIISQTRTKNKTERSRPNLRDVHTQYRWQTLAVNVSEMMAIMSWFVMSECADSRKNNPVGGTLNKPTNQTKKPNRNETTHPLKYGVLFQLRHSVRPVATAAAATATTAAVVPLACLRTFLLKKPKPTVDVLWAAARILHAATRHRHADDENADGHHNHRRQHRHEEVQVEPFGQQLGEIHLAVVVAPVQAVQWGCQRTYPVSICENHPQWRHFE